jgi:putative transcriptional regulator
MNSLRGKLLIAEPRLPDSNFFRSVVLVIEHTDGGASGLILNRPGSIRLSEVWSNVSDSPLGRDEMIFIGGPVEGPLAILHDQSELSEQGLIEGLHLSLRRENLDELLSDDSARLRVFSGYSGWGPGQLDQEMHAGGWLTWPARADHVFDDPETLYKSVCDSLGLEILFGQAQPKHRPADPTMN